MSTFLLVCSAALALATGLSVLKFECWWIRIFDFPRLQLATLSAVVLGANLAFLPLGPLLWTGVALTAFALIGQALSIIPYTPLWSKQTKQAVGGLPTLRLLIANVEMENRRADGLFEFIERTDPDLILLCEPDQWWEQTFARLEKGYPHVMREPRANTYGMLLYSKIELLERDRRFIIESEVPSFHASIRVGDCAVRLHFVHPKPPVPGEAEASTGRDAELIIVGREAAQEGPAIVAGDLNDVAWSHTTRLFQRLSGLLDPRRGRGMCNTHHARYFFARWPLDHLFHSDHFRLVSMVRGAAYGSDHFPIFVALELDAAARREQPTPQDSRADQVEADQKLERAADEQGGER
jgi:endonuclease/exonuclease/phosphatase (EEP) superfamily protein YafD